jgi:hypothetical protein
MEDFFTGKPTLLRGAELPDAKGRAHLYDTHKRRLAALDSVVAAAKKCGVRTNPDGDLILLPEEEVSLFLQSGDCWGDLSRAVGRLREILPILSLDRFGFSTATENLHEMNAHLRRIGSGVEAWAFISGDHSIYKFFRPIGNGKIGATFDFRSNADGEPRLIATNAEGSYRDLFEKLRLIETLGGMPSEVLAITPEGIVVVKQTLGEAFNQGEDVSGKLPPELIVIPSIFLRANRDHPRLLFLDDVPWLVADLHARNFVRAVDGTHRVIDLIAAPWPDKIGSRETLMANWVSIVRADPKASLLTACADEEL